MLESFAAWILNTYIGDHFGNVNTHQLRMSLKNGEIELERLPLKRDLIKHLGLPLDAKTGFIGKISIKFPSWHSFTSEPLVITIEDLFLIVKPITNYTYNEEEENRAQQEFKLSQLDMMEQRWKALHDEALTEPSSYYSSSYSSWLNYGSSIINNVLMNIHMKISSIHIRYEDYSTIPGCPFSCGVVIRSLTICSTDDQWQPKYVSSMSNPSSQSSSGGGTADNFLFKLIDMESFSCYCDTDTNLFGHLDLMSMVDGMRETLDKNVNRKHVEVDHSYMIAPVNGKCYLKRNCSEMSLKSCRQPRTVIDVQLERVPIMMTAIQYKHLLDWSLAFQTQKTLWKYRKWRPMILHQRHRTKSSSKDKDEDDHIEDNIQQEQDTLFDAKTWWHFAVNANLEEYRQRRQRFNWHFIMSRVRDVLGYHRAYLHYLIQPESFTKEMRYIKDRVEQEFTLDELCSIREIVFWRADQFLKRQMRLSSNQWDQPQPLMIEASPETDREESNDGGGYWFLPYNLLSNLYTNYNSNQTNNQVDNSPETEDEPEGNIPTRVSGAASTSSLNMTSCSSTEDIFLTRDAIYCQFNFQIHNSSFQLIAFSSIDDDEQRSHNQTSTNNLDNNQSFISASSSFLNLNQESQYYQQQGNLLLEFEFNQMKIGVDITNPNAYACACHQQRGSRSNNHYLSRVNSQQEKTLLTQNELNQLQLDLNFICENLNLTLLRTDDILISENDLMQKLATATLTGCGLQFIFSTDMISIDGKMESFQLVDLITAPHTNKHKRVLSIGKRASSMQQMEAFSKSETEQQSESSSSVHQVEKALSFSLCRQMNENILRVNVEMASFCYIHSSLFMYELALCRKCFSDVLEAYFSRAFKERVKQATTEVLRGIVPPAESVSTSSAVPPSPTASTSTNLDSSDSCVAQSAPILLQNISTGKMSGRLSYQKQQKQRRKVATSKSSSKSKSKWSSTNLFVENLRLNVFIRSPVIICPISPSSDEVVVFHLGHMLLNNHNHSADISGQTLNLGRGQMILWKPQRQRKMASTSSMAPPTITSSSPTTNTLNNSYNAEIRDLSVYSLDCSKNVHKYYSGLESSKERKSCPETLSEIPVEGLYDCDTFGVPILQKTIIEIVLERKMLFSQMLNNNSSTKGCAKVKLPNGHQYSPEGSPSPTPQTVLSTSNMVDGLNLISSVNSIDPLVLPKKFSIRQHLIHSQDIHHHGLMFASSLMLEKTSKSSKTNGPEMVLSIEISTIDVRFSYTDLLVFWHILNTLTSPPELSVLPHVNQSLDETATNTAQNTVQICQNNTEEDEELNTVLQQLTLSTSGLDAEEFRSRLNNLIDLGFDPRESLRALALKNGDIIEAAYMLSSSSQTNNNIDATSGQTDRQSPDMATNTTNDSASNNRSSEDGDNHSQCTSVSTMDGTGNTANSGANHSNEPNKWAPHNKAASKQYDNGEHNTLHGRSSKRPSMDNKKRSNLLLSILSVIEIKILNGSIRIIDDCNQLDLPLLQLGISDLCLMQYYTSPTIEAHAQTNFYCDYFNSHLSGWEPFIEHCQVAFSWKHHEPRCHLKSMLNQAAIASTPNRIPVARQKLAIKIDVRKMFNLNVSRTMLDLCEKVNHSWRQDIEHFMSLPVEHRRFRHRQPFIPFALKNDTGTDLQIYIGNQRKMFSTAKAADLITPCDLKPALLVKSYHEVSFDCVDLNAASEHHPHSCSAKHHQSNGQNQPGRSSSAALSTSALKIYVKVDGWIQTFPLSIEREGTFIRHITSERYTNHSAILVFEIKLQSSAIKLITVRSSLLITNRTTKLVELKFVNTAMSDVPTSYMIKPQAVFPVPLDLLYARIQLRPYDMGIGACSTYINWNHVKKFGELDCSLQICTPITHTQYGSYSKSQPYVVSVLVERNSIGALIESRDIFRYNQQQHNNYLVHKPSPLVILPSHTITLLPPLQLANRLPYELRFKIHNSSNSFSTGTIKSGDDYSVHYISPLEAFSIEFQMEHFPRCRPLHVEPGAIKSYQTHIEMCDARNRLLILNATVTVQTGCSNPSNAMTITIYAPYWIVNRSGLPLVFAQEQGSSSVAVEEAAGQYEEHERARSISPLLFSFSEPDSPQYCIMRLGRMMPQMIPRWCNLFCLEKGTFYRRLRVTEYAQDSQLASVPVEKIYEFGIDIRQGRDRYIQTKIVTIAPRFQIENLTSFKLEFAQKCQVEQVYQQTNQPIDSNGFVPSYMSSPIKSSHHHYRSNSFGSRHSSMSISESDQFRSQIISALPKSNMPFHWPCSDKPKLLCVRIASLIGCLWSGCFDVGSEPSVSFHLNIRDDSGRSNFIRVEILLQNTTYFIVFTDANSLPPPIRVENFSQVAIEFYQQGSMHRTMVRPNCSVPYALDEPTEAAHITVCAPGGSTSTYDLNSFAPGDPLTYDNFYYLAFEETFTSAVMGNVGYFAPTAEPYYDDDETEQLMFMMMAPGQQIQSDYSFLSELNDVGSKMLVLDVPDDEPRTITSGSLSGEDKCKPVILGRKERGKRSQLWRLDGHNHLIHEGSSPPLEPGGTQDLGFAKVKFSNCHSNAASSVLMVLDVVDDQLTMLTPATKQANHHVSIPLAVRKLNPLRKSTQTWHFTEDGRLRCSKYWNMFVQPLSPHASNESDLFQTGTMAVIGPGPLESTVTKSTIPKEQAVLKQKMRKGSGVLNVCIMPDGPSRVLKIKDNQLTANGRHLIHYTSHHHSGLHHYHNQSNDGAHRPLTELFLRDHHQQQQQQQSFLMRLLNKTEMELNLQIDSIGISLISKTNEEIVFIFMKKIILELLCNPAECRMNCVVEDLQVDNQLLNCEKEVVLYVTNLESTSESQASCSSGLVSNAASGERPAIIFNLHKLFIPNVEINVFKSLQMNLNDLVLNIEELVLLKLLEFINYDPVDLEMDQISSTTGSNGSNGHSANSSLLYHTSGNVISSSLSRSVQYFFAYLWIQLQRVKLSVFTSSTPLGKYLSELKKKAGIKLIRFEEALIQLKPFHKIYSLMTRKFLQDSIHEHYRSELRSQAAKIMGTVDFLGNPVGLINNVVEGLNEFYYDHSLRGLIMNVTHGLSDSTAKFTNVLSESLGLATMDDRHQEIRRKIKQQSQGIGGQRSHLVVGTFGLVHGILGGITSVITQTYDGIVNHGGVTGFISGFGKGVLGTITKPAVGMLDFASGAATAVRDSSRKACFGMNGRQVKRVRLPRTLTMDGRLTRYQSQQSQWQARFYNSTDFGSQREYGEQYVHVFALSDRHFVLLTTERLYFFHAPVKKCRLPSDDEENENDADFAERTGFRQQQDLQLIACPIQQLQILPLEHFVECNHHRMAIEDSQYFLHTHSTCPELTSMIGTTTTPTSNSGGAICHFIEFRQTSRYCTSSNDVTLANITESSQAHHNNNNNANDANAKNVKNRLEQQGRKQSFEYPRHLSPCYVYCDDPQMIQKCIQMINEAKHLQEERKFEVSNLDLAN